MIPATSVSRTVPAHRVAQSHIPIQPTTFGLSIRTVKTAAEPKTCMSPERKVRIAAARRQSEALA